jgi:hypothetical protein
MSPRSRICRFQVPSTAIFLARVHRDALEAVRDPLRSASDGEQQRRDRVRVKRREASASTNGGVGLIVLQLPVVC